MLGCEILHFTPQHLTLNQKNNTNSDFVSVFVLFPCGGSEGIRTPEPVKTTRFPIVPVMTASIRFRNAYRKVLYYSILFYYFCQFIFAA